MGDSGAFESMLLALAILLGIPVLLIRIFLGERGFEKFKASWAFEITRFILTAPFKLISYICKTIFEAIARWKPQSFWSWSSLLQLLRKLF